MAFLLLLLPVLLLVGRAKLSANIRPCLVFVKKCDVERVCDNTINLMMVVVIIIVINTMPYHNHNLLAPLIYNFVTLLS